MAAPCCRATPGREKRIASAFAGYDISSSRWDAAAWPSEERRHTRKPSVEYLLMHSERLYPSPCWKQE